MRMSGHLSFYKLPHPEWLLKHRRRDSISNLLADTDAASTDQPSQLVPFHEPNLFIRVGASREDHEEVLFNRQNGRTAAQHKDYLGNTAKNCGDCNRITQNGDNNYGENNGDQNGIIQLGSYIGHQHSSLNAERHSGMIISIAAVLILFHVLRLWLSS
ncbi:hypothetical protein F5Y04DRAFT_19888 [Hypomontagnella monticulosa]|nr:hypothetical protein F5Y04DRAFT_19888 [Hypomontagnella monticulosa]